jgi:hypothetical protein
METILQADVILHLYPGKITVPLGFGILLQKCKSLLLHLLPARQQGLRNASRALALADGSPARVGTTQTLPIVIVAVHDMNMRSHRLTHVSIRIRLDPL